MRYLCSGILLIASLAGATANLDPKTSGEALQAATLQIAQLDALLHNDEANIEKRWQAATSMGRIGGLAAEARLLEALRSPNFMVRMAAIKGIELLANQDNMARLLPHLHEALADKAMVVRAAVADTLAVWKQRESLAFLEGELRKPRNYYRGRSLWVREHMIHAIGAIGGEQSVRILVTCLTEGDARIVAAAWNALNPLYALTTAELQLDSQKKAWLTWQEESLRIGPPPPPDLPNSTPTTPLE